MKKKSLIIPLSVLTMFALAGCGTNVDRTTTLPEASGNTSSGGSSSEVVVNETEAAPTVENTGDFDVTGKDEEKNEVEVEVEQQQTDKVYKITEAGTYTFSGVLEEGQILVEAGEDDEVVIELNGVTLTNSNDAPIKIISADKVEISAKSGTSNKVVDNRSAKKANATDDGTIAEGAINAKCDLKLKGSGTLVVVGNYNNGVHTSDDLTVQKQTLHVTAYNNALKGKDSVTVESGNITLVSKTGNGIKTDNTNKSSKDVQRGVITINGGTLTIDTPFDAIDASYNVVINEEDAEGAPTVITAKTGRYATYSSNYSSSGSSKGIKAANGITINAGDITIKATDDAIHANYGDTIESGGVGQGTINVNGGNIGIASGDDGIHADNSLTINGGTINITNAGEGIEANHVYIKGGETYIYGTDDGVNASKKINQTPTVEISGGFLDISMATGDTDGIDSNGNFTQTGGFVVTRGAHGTSGAMATGLDVDGTCSITGGTFIAFNGVEKTPSTASTVYYAYYGTTGNQGMQPGGGPTGPGGRWSVTTSSVNTSAVSTKFAAGTYTLSGGDLTKTFTNLYTYSTFLVYSSEFVTGTSYTLSLGNTTVLSWTQSSRTVQIS